MLLLQTRMAALLKFGDIVGHRNSACGRTFDAEAVALQASVHGDPWRDAEFSVRGQNHGRETSCHGQPAWQAAGEVLLLHLIFRA